MVHLSMHDFVRMASADRKSWSQFLKIGETTLNFSYMSVSFSFP